MHWTVKEKLISIGVRQWKALCVNVLYIHGRKGERDGKIGGVIEKACESQRKCICGDKCRSLESGCLRVTKVSADVEMWNVMNRFCVGKLRKGTGNIFRSVWDN